MLTDIDAIKCKLVVKFSFIRTHAYSKTMKMSVEIGCA